MPEQITILPIKIETIGPVHIGMGEDYCPTDYVIKNEKLHVIDKNKFLDDIYQQKDKWADFLSCSMGIDLRKIQEFFKNNFKLEHAAYSVPIADIAIANQIDRMIRNLFFHEPYIPGSSLKGAFQTAIYNVMGKECKLDSLSFSDFNKVEGEEMIDFLRYFHFKGDPGSKEHIKAELISSRSVYIGEIRIHKNTFFSKTIKQKFSSQENLNLKQIFSKLLNSYYQEEILNKFESAKFEISNKSTPSTECSENQFLMKIGKHTGAYAMTMHPDQKGKIKIINSKNRDYYFADHQTTLWFTQNEKKPIGWVRLSFIEADEFQDLTNKITRKRAEYQDHQNFIHSDTQNKKSALDTTDPIQLEQLLASRFSIKPKQK